MPRPQRSFRIAFAVACLATLIGALPAAATYPGRNGRIAFSQGDPGPNETPKRSQVFTIRANGSGLRQLTHVGKRTAAAAPDFSPDGTRIAYQSNKGGRYGIWAMNADGSGQTRLTGEPGYEHFQPSFSPDGDRIVFSRCFEPFGFSASCEIAEVNADGSGLRTVFSAGNWTNIRPGYSPDGESIVFSSDLGGLLSAVWVIGTDGSSPRRLTAPNLLGFWPDWSPDGARIVFSDNCCRPRSNIWTVGADGAGTTKLTNFKVNGAFASYSPDGKKMVLATDDVCKRESPCDDLVTMRADGSRQKRLKTGISPILASDWGPR